MSATVRTVTKALAAEEDILFGEGTAQQTRAGVAYQVTKFRNMRPVNSIDELNNLDFNKFPKAMLVENGIVKFYQHNGAVYEELIPVTRVSTETAVVTNISAISKQTIIFNVASAHTIASINNGVIGQELNLISSTNNTTIANNANIVLKGGSDYLIPANTGLKLVYTGSVWAEV
jgi:hypothetical protein